MLRSLSGRTHQVVTAVTMLFHAGAEATVAAAAAAAGSAGSNAASTATSAASAASAAPPLEVSFSVQTDVTFAELSDAVLRMYVDSNEPMSVRQRDTWKSGADHAHLNAATGEAATNRRLASSIFSTRIVSSLHSAAAALPLVRWRSCVCFCRDKAGGYGYQSVAATLVREIHGCYYNVVGFPLHQIAVHLQPHLDPLIAAAEKRQVATAASSF
jgi:predicted house-cleaning NTP pyrophosphatase (Maf/HAM1 superfamily)